MKFEALIEDHYGHFCRWTFEADSYEEALEKARKVGFNHESNDDYLWQV